MAFIVVGHGRSPEGKGWGRKIDQQSNFVVRMWDWYPWQRALDYGRRYDFGLFVVTPKGLRLFKQHNQRTPKYAWLAYIGKPVDPRDMPPNITCFHIPTAPWCNWIKQQGGSGLKLGEVTLTRGTAAACWAINNVANYYKRERRVILVGFDNVFKGINNPIDESFSPEYWTLYMSRFSPDVEKVYPIGGSKTATHDMAYEWPLLMDQAKRNRVQLEMAEHIWK